jgi:hypothetical protein
MTFFLQKTKVRSTAKTHIFYISYRSEEVIYYILLHITSTSTSSSSIRLDSQYANTSYIIILLSQSSECTLYWIVMFKECCILSGSAWLVIGKLKF